jgi:hypothetical protein
LFYLVPAQFVSLSGSKKPNVKLETRSGVQILSERVGLGASYSTSRLMVAGGKAEQILNAGQSGKGATATGETPMLF